MEIARYEWEIFLQKLIGTVHEAIDGCDERFDGFGDHASVLSKRSCDIGQVF